MSSLAMALEATLSRQPPCCTWLLCTQTKSGFLSWMSSIGQGNLEIQLQPTTSPRSLWREAETGREETEIILLSRFATPNHRPQNLYHITFGGASSSWGPTTFLGPQKWVLTMALYCFQFGHSIPTWPCIGGEQQCIYALFRMLSCYRAYNPNQPLQFRRLFNTYTFATNILSTDTCKEQSIKPPHFCLCFSYFKAIWIIE